MSDKQERLQIGEFARLAGSNLRTLRYYEELGLLKPVSRSSGGFRYYEHRQLDRMIAIKRLQDLGLSLREIAERVIGNGDPSGPELLTRLRSTLEKQIALTETKIAAMQKDLNDLETSRNRLVEMCEGCEVPFSRENCDPCTRGNGSLSTMILGLL